MVEDIVTMCALSRGHHEDIADGLKRSLGGKQTLSALHHGVEIETVR